MNPGKRLENCWFSAEEIMGPSGTFFFFLNLWKEGRECTSFVFVYSLTPPQEVVCFKVDLWSGCGGSHLWSQQKSGHGRRMTESSGHGDTPLKKKKRQTNQTRKTFYNKNCLRTHSIDHGPWIQRSICLCILSAGIKGMCYHCPALSEDILQESILSFHHTQVLRTELR